MKAPHMFSTVSAALLLVISKNRFFRHKLVIRKKLLYDYSNNQKGRQSCFTLDHQPSSPETSALVCKLVIQKSSYTNQQRTLQEVQANDQAHDT
jgi:hypothetical protein